MRPGALKALLIGLLVGLLVGAAICVPLWLLGLRDQFVFNAIGAIVGFVSMNWSCDRYMR